jgi:hypothetical protein
MRYTVEFDGYAWWVIDTSIPDGEACNVYGCFSRVEALAKCEELNGTK